MVPAAQLSKTFAANYQLASRFLEGTSHEEGLFIPEYRINTINWVLGHIINGRNEALEYLGKPAMWGEQVKARYGTGSDPISARTALALEDLLAAFEESQADLEMALAEVSDAYLQEVVETRFGDLPRWRHISGLAWHETFHVGQLDLLRQMVLDAREKDCAR